ncbi:MAG: SDR family NAD(P)-dependent oxidoreductase, partial [Pseudomonadota bacterium]
MTAALTGTAIVTGASGGIGEAVVRYLAASGMTVVLAARRRARVEAIAAGIVGAGGRALAREADVADPAAVAALVDTAMAETGRLDLMVNNAGTIEPIARLADSDPAAWGAVIDVNLKGV